ncbi:hypothetical protein AB0L41_39460 [Amycolatopsis mediterranei]|uniref:hypothetical protein n=1 Tax=Amycolatopsis mediterranei TaxID=33910 RepID=UPI003427B644
MLVIAIAGVTWRNAPRRQVALQPLSVKARVFYFGFAAADLAASADASFRVWHDVLTLPGRAVAAEAGLQVVNRIRKSSYAH